ASSCARTARTWTGGGPGRMRGGRRGGRMDREQRQREQHKRRLSWMPWLYFSLKPKHREWAEPWQREVQEHFRNLETIEIAEGCFIAPEAQLFAEPGRTLVIGPGCAIAANVF